MFVLTIVVCMFAIVGAVYAVPRVTATLTASPAAYSGNCPTTINFRGMITASEAGRVQYKFIRSDGANAPVQTLIFAKAETKPVSTTWTLGANYTGWEAIKVIYPVSVESNKANFTVRCAGAAQGEQFRATLRAEPTSYTGQCPTTIKFIGTITSPRAGNVQYKFIRSDGANAPVQTLNFTAPGTKPVNTTWMLGRSYTGWEAVKIVYPQEVESNKANFKITCQTAR